MQQIEERKCCLKKEEEEEGRGEEKQASLPHFKTRVLCSNSQEVKLFGPWIAEGTVSV